MAINPLDPLGAGTSRTARLGQGSPGGLQRPVGLLNPLDPLGSATRVTPRLGTRAPVTPSGIQRTGQAGVQLPKDLAYQARTIADAISTNSSLSPTQRKQAEERAIAQFESRNLPPQFMTAIKDVITQRRAYGERQNASTLQAVQHVLGFIENTEAGFLSGTAAFQKAHGITSWKDQWKYAAHPSYIYKELGAGFKDIPSGIEKGKTFDQLAKETTDPSSFLYRYSMPIGLGMSVLFDPTTYMTVGASSASKAAAYHILAEGDSHAFPAAGKIIRDNYGKMVETTQGPVVANWYNLDQFVTDVKIKNNLPISIGDALDLQHAEGLGIKQSIRKTGEYWSGKTGEMVPASLREKATARLLPNNVRGGRGIRFAGRSVPGTPELGAKLGQRFRASSEEIGSVGHDIGEALIPQWGARHVVDDGARASALVEMAKYRTAISRAQMNIGRDVRSLQRPMVPVETQAAEQVAQEAIPQAPGPRPTAVDVSLGGTRTVAGGPVPVRATPGTYAAVEKVFDLTEEIIGDVGHMEDFANRLAHYGGNEDFLYGEAVAHDVKDPEGFVGQLGGMLEYLRADATSPEDLQKIDDVAKELYASLETKLSPQELADLSRPVGSLSMDIGKQIEQSGVQLTPGVRGGMIEEIGRKGYPTEAPDPNASHFNQEGRDEIGNLAEWFAAVSPEEIAADPWKAHFPVLYDPKSKKFYIGAPGQGHDDIYENVPELMEKWEAGELPGGPTPRLPQTAPTTEELADAPYLNYFRVWVNPENPLDIVAGAPGLDHYENHLEDIPGLEESVADWYQGTGYFDEEGNVSGVNVVRRGEDNFEGVEPLPEGIDQEKLDADATRAAKVAYGQGPKQLHPLASKSRGLVEGTGIIDPETGEVGALNIFAGEAEHLTSAVTPEGLELQQRAMDEAKAKYEDAQRIVGRQADNEPREEVLHSIASDGPKFERVLVKPKERIGLMTMDPSEMSPAQKILRNNIEVTSQVYIDKAVASGINEKEITRLWDMTLDYYEDPLMALAEFKFKASARAMGKDFTQQILNDPRFAIPMNTKAAAHSIAQRDILEPGVDLGKLDEAPRGYTEFTEGNRRYAVRNSIIEGLRELNNPTRIDNSLQKGFRRLNIAQDYWKLYATSPNPAFHVMNFLGAVWNNMLAGVYNPADYFDALKLLYKGRKEEAAQAGAKFGAVPGLRRVPESTEAGRAAQQTLTEAEARSGLGRSSFLFADVSRGHYTPEQLAVSDLPLSETASMFEKLQVQALESGKGFVKRQVTPAMGVSKKRTYGVTVPRKAAGIALAAHANPLAFAMFLPEIANAGRKVGGTIEDLVRLAPFMKYSNDPAVRRVLANYGPINSSMEIGWKGFTKEDQQTMYDIGAHISRHFQFDYSDLTSMERYVAKTVFPFWVYYKKNTALQITQLVHKPVTFAVANRMMNYLNENSGMELGPWKEILPSYFNNLNAFQVPVPNTIRDKLGLPHDQPMYLNPKMPFLSINLIPNFVDILRNPNQTSSQKVLEILAPAFGSVGPFAAFPFPGGKMLLEAGTGHNLGLNRPIDFQRASSNDLRQSYVPAPSWIKYLPTAIQREFFHAHENPKTGKLEVTATANYVIQQMSAPFINNLGQSIAVQGATAEERDKSRANLVSWLTGVRLIPVDVLRLDRNAAYTLLDQLEAEQSELRARGEMMSTDKIVMLARIRADLEVINYAYDKREADPSAPAKEPKK